VRVPGGAAAEGALLRVRLLLPEAELQVLAGKVDSRPCTEERRHGALARIAGGVAELPPRLRAPLAEALGGVWDFALGTSRRGVSLSKWLEAVEQTRRRARSAAAAHLVPLVDGPFAQGLAADQQPALTAPCHASGPYQQAIAPRGSLPGQGPGPLPTLGPGFTTRAPPGLQTELSPAFVLSTTQTLWSAHQVGSRPSSQPIAPEGLVHGTGPVNEHVEAMVPALGAQTLGSTSIASAGTASMLAMQTSPEAGRLQAVFVTASAWPLHSLRSQDIAAPAMAHFTKASSSTGALSLAAGFGGSTTMATRPLPAVHVPAPWAAGERRRAADARAAPAVALGVAARPFLPVKQPPCKRPPPQGSAPRADAKAPRLPAPSECGSS